MAKAAPDSQPPTALQILEKRVRCGVSVMTAPRRNYQTSLDMYKCGTEGLTVELDALGQLILRCQERSFDDGAGKATGVAIRVKINQDVLMAWLGALIDSKDGELSELRTGGVTL